MTMLIYICLKFYIFPIPSLPKGDLETLTMVPLKQRLYEQQMAEERSWYHHNTIDALLFEEWESH